MDALKLRLGIAVIKGQLRRQDITNAQIFFDWAYVLPADRKCHPDLAIWSLEFHLRKKLRDDNAASYMFLAWEQMDWLSYYFTEAEQTEMLYLLLAKGSS